jgi:hypothetical protein
MPGPLAERAMASRVQVLGATKLPSEAEQVHLLDAHGLKRIEAGLPTSFHLIGEPFGLSRLLRVALRACLGRFTSAR